MNNSMIIELFDDCKNTSDFIRIICDNFQGWLITKSDKYSDDYTCLQDNWFRLTQNLNIQIQKILLVNEVHYEPFNILSDFLTKKGFCVRLYSEFNPCEICKSVIPCIDLWRNLKSQGKNVPENWYKNCIICKEQNRI